MLAPTLQQLKPPPRHPPVQSIYDVTNQHERDTHRKQV